MGVQARSAGPSGAMPGWAPASARQPPALGRAPAHASPAPRPRRLSPAGHWVLVEGGEEALKEAVLTKGPMVVSSEPLDGG